ncbi:WD40/YVTN repeat-like-containing domain,Domain of unknown function DUF382,PSP, proline-rich [Cinara cedri]|uniref:PSP proline-rich domain-containing protein n=1 Tax=Cinara cedri TaxID=506608 RepID=A0A5E4N659_9HEMI|nr:WD40/YVTN repeat-like-containing domain,Domain of unknown function DUF382,PSP, proline-rich [Cinara cedri]
MYEPEEELLYPPGEDVALPPALERVLNYNEERAKQIGVIDTVTEQVSNEALMNTVNIINEEEYDQEKTEEKQKQKQVVLKLSTEDRKRVKRRKKKYNKKMKKKLKTEQKKKEKLSSSNKKNKADKSDKIEIEYVQESISVLNLLPMYRSYAKVFENFKIPESKQIQAGVQEDTLSSLNLKKVPKLPEHEDDNHEEDKDENILTKIADKLSKKQLKKMSRLSVAELKQLVSRPDVVEMHDVMARDPDLLIQLKAYRNTVPVPRHWCFKRKYLQGKRGIENSLYDLPDFIKQTGIMEMRAVHQEKEAEKSLKNKMREKVKPKIGKIDIDYKKLHDAFFKLQMKPRLTLHGDLYYEGKEHEVKLREKKPGDLSAELRTALGMPIGYNSHKVPPPWLIAMQRYGPPPSYPALKIPGLNAVIPEGCSFGYHAGGWGKPPIDERGRPLYGNVFGNLYDNNGYVAEEQIDKCMWGELDSDTDVEEYEEEEEEDEEEIKETKEVTNDVSDNITLVDKGLATPSGIMSGLPSGYETPEYIELRKRKIESKMESSEQQPLFHVLPEKKVETVCESMMASTHIYEIPTVISGKVEVSLDPSELELTDDMEAMVAMYERNINNQQGGKDDGTEMDKKKGGKRKAAQEAKASKKYKDFKF